LRRERMKLPSWVPVVLLALTACAPAAPATTGGAAPAQPAEERAERQIIRIGSNALPNNPTPQGGATFHTYYAPLYDTLTWFGPGFSIVPAIAERWELAPDGMAWTFTLRRDVRWPDGALLTANDVVFSLMIINQLNWPQRALLAMIRDATAVDAHTVRFALNSRDVTLPNAGPQFRIIQQAYWERVGGFDGFLARPQGSGPYELVEFRPGDVTRYRKRPERHAFRDTPAEEVIFRVIPDVAQQINGLRLGELDVILGSFTPDQVETMQRAGLIISMQETTSSHVNFPISTIVARNSPLGDRRVREAINYAVDKEAIARGVYRGTVRPVGQMGTPGSPWWDDSVPPWPFNPQRARQLLAEAGYPNGFRVTYDLQPGQVPMEQVLAIQGNLRDVGIEMEIIQNDQATFLDRYFGRAPKADLFPLVSGETNGFFVSFRNAYTCGPQNTGILGIYCNPEVDRLFNQAYGEPDPARRAELFRQANRVMRADVPQLWLVTLNQGVATGPKVRGLNIVTPTAFNFDSLYLIR
ncbi:MAG: ABC transporter substrate-binding protein, partial [Dehalococcoidia bacterium]|nr:ABC transporter substrate-binding protein [Dehalococcoidia bacterium]